MSSLRKKGIVANPIHPGVQAESHPHLHPRHSNRCHPACTVHPACRELRTEPQREPSRSERSEGSASDFSRLRVLSVSTFRSPTLSPSTSNLQRSFRKSPHQYQSTAFTLPLFSYCYALFCTVKIAISNRFIPFHTLFAKHPEGYTLATGAGQSLDNQPPSRLVSLPPCFITSLPRPMAHPLKPLPHIAHPYTCTCKKGPAAREPRYSPCAAS